MSLYRVASRRSRLLSLLVPAALVVGLVAGFAVGRSTAPERSLADALEEPAAHVRTARDALELLTIEYPQAVAGGRVTATTEYEAARADARRARDELAQASGLEELAPDAYRSARSRVDEVATLVERKAPPDEVGAAARDAEDALASLPGG